MDYSWSRFKEVLFKQSHRLRFYILPGLENIDIFIHHQAIQDIASESGQ